MLWSDQRWRAGIAEFYTNLFCHGDHDEVRRCCDTSHHVTHLTRHVTRGPSTCANLHGSVAIYAEIYDRPISDLMCCLMW